jgi:hypothetical protein
MAIAKGIGWAIYAPGFVIWIFGYFSAGHASAFDWDVAVVDFKFRSQLRSRTRTCAHVREHDPDLLADRTEASGSSAPAILLGLAPARGLRNGRNDMCKKWASAQKNQIAANFIVRQ